MGERTFRSWVAGLQLSFPELGVFPPVLGAEDEPPLPIVLLLDFLPLKKDGRFFSAYAGLGPRSLKANGRRAYASWLDLGGRGRLDWEKLEAGLIPPVLLEYARPLNGHLDVIPYLCLLRKAGKARW